MLAFNGNAVFTVLTHVTLAQIANHVARYFKCDVMRSRQLAGVTTTSYSATSEPTCPLRMQDTKSLSLPKRGHRLELKRGTSVPKLRTCHNAFRRLLEV